MRERIARLLDPATSHESGALAGKGAYEDGQLAALQPANFVLGSGRIEGREVIVDGDDRGGG